MADYYILDGDDEGKVYRIAFHIPAPTGTNTQGQTYTDILQEDPNHITASVIPGLSGAEQALLTDGSKVEIIKTLRTHGGHDLVKNRGTLDDMYKRVKEETQKKLTFKYRFWKFTRTVPNK